MTRPHPDRAEDGLADAPAVDGGPGGRGPTWTAACPNCRTPLGPLDGAGPLPCESCGTTYLRRDGIWSMLAPGEADRFARFLSDYQAVRRAEGRGSDDGAYYQALPEVPATDPLAWQWRIRARTWSCFERRCLPPLGAGLRVADVGAGVGWLSNRLARLGHWPVAMDVNLDGRDGLGAAAHYRAPWPRVQASFDNLPLADGQADLVVYNASLHYSTDYAVTLAEALRVLRPTGAIVVLDTPLYRHEESGRQMVAERHADFEARFGTRSDTVPSIEYLTEARLAGLAEELGLAWQRTTPWYGLRWAARPLRARLKGAREPSRFVVLIARRRTSAPGG